MTVPASQSDLPKNGLAWFTLAASTCALILLSVWALLNQDLLFKGVQFKSDVAQAGSTRQTVVTQELDTRSLALIAEEEKKAVMENTKHYQDNWKKYSKSIFR